MTGGFLIPLNPFQYNVYTNLTPYPATQGK